MMRVRWFGDPWPEADRRAPVCEDDRFQVPLDKVVGTKCLECKGLITERDHGVITACSAGIWGNWLLEITEDIPDEYPMDEGEVGVWTVCSYHLKCFLGVVVGNEIQGSVMERMYGARKVASDMTEDKLQTITTEEVASGDEQAETGRGWKKSG